MLGTAFREGDDAYSVPPASKMWIAGEERVEFSVRSASQPNKVGLAEALVTARRIAINAFAMRHAGPDDTGLG